MTLLSITGNSSRQLSPLKEDEAAMLGALDVVAMIAPTDALMATDMRLVGLGNVPMEAVHHPAMERVLEQIRVQGDDD